MTHCVNKQSNQEVKKHCHHRSFRLMFRLLCSTQRPLESLVSSHRNKSTMSTGGTGDLRNNSENRSIHSDNIDEVHNVPMDVITRPIPSILDEVKVQSLMKTIMVICV